MRVPEVSMSMNLLDAETHAADIVRAYDSQGPHRTGTDVDHASARWLQCAIAELGAQPALDTYALDRVDPVSSFLRVGNRRIDGVPAFDGGATGLEGIVGRLGPVGSDCEIALAVRRVSVPGLEAAKAHGLVEELAGTSHKAMVVATLGPAPGLSLFNANSFSKPSSIPVLQVSGVDAEWLLEKAERRDQVSICVHTQRRSATTSNVWTRVTGREPNLPPVVVTTPRSGWWNCASERGGGIACWLAALGAVVAGGVPRRTCYFAAFSGHELGLLGIANFLKGHPELSSNVHCWCHFGANIGASRHSIYVQATSEELTVEAQRALSRHQVPIADTGVLPGPPRGEASFPYRLGLPFVAPIAGSDVFHNQLDCWPSAVDVGVLARTAMAFAELVAVKAQ